MLSILCVRLTIKVKVEIPESFKVGWYPPKKTGSRHLKYMKSSASEFIRSACFNLERVSAFLFPPSPAGNFDFGSTFERF